MRPLIRLAGYFVAAVLVITLIALVIAGALDSDVVQTISVALIIGGAGIAAVGALTVSGPPTPDFPGLEREYIRYVHHQNAAERRVWQNDNLLLVLGGTALAALGVAVALL